MTRAVGYPASTRCPGFDCKVIGRNTVKDEREVITISTGHDGVESKDGVDHFDVMPDQLLEGEFLAPPLPLSRVTSEMRQRFRFWSPRPPVGSATDG